MSTKKLHQSPGLEVNLTTTGKITAPSERPVFYKDKEKPLAASYGYTGPSELQLLQQIATNLGEINIPNLNKATDDVANGSDDLQGINVKALNFAVELAILFYWSNLPTGLRPEVPMELIEKLKKSHE